MSDFSHSLTVEYAASCILQLLIPDEVRHCVVSLTVSSRSWELERHIVDNLRKTTVVDGVMNRIDAVVNPAMQW